MKDQIVLFDYWRSSASYRVRIALAMKGIAYTKKTVNLLESEQEGEAYSKINPQHFVPALQIDGETLTQSLAIIEYLEEARDGPKLVFGSLKQRTEIRKLAYAIAQDVHPVMNLNVMNFLAAQTGGEELALVWRQHFLLKGLAAYEKLIQPHIGKAFSCSDEPSMADVCLIPQVYNARRFGVDLDAFPRIREIDGECNKMDAFKAAYPTQD